MSKWLAVFVFFCLISCTYTPDSNSRNSYLFNSDEYHNEEIRVLNDLFHELIGNYYNIPPVVQTSDSIASSQLREEYEYQRMFVGDTITVLIYDTLFVYHKPEYRNADWLKRLQLESAFKDLLVLLIDSMQTYKKLDLHSISHPENYKLIGSRLERDMPVIQISRMAFNENFTKGVFYHSIFHHGYFVFVEKLNNKWNVLHRELLWVS